MTKPVNLAAIATVPRYRFHLHGPCYSPWYEGVGMLFEFLRRVYRPAYETDIVVAIHTPIAIQRREPVVLGGHAL